jgi:peptidoglycan hydrolase-like protein with peptidoglycan-binding domain
MPMMRGKKIGEIQQALTKAGFSTKGIDNAYGPDTKKAVEAFQEANGLVVDGEVSKETATTLGVDV